MLCKICGVLGPLPVAVLGLHGDLKQHLHEDQAFHMSQKSFFALS